MNETKPKELIISLQLVEAIGNYLVARPYAEVFQLIPALQQLQPALKAEPYATRHEEMDAKVAE